MTEPKRRGRPPKARSEGCEVPVINGHEAACPECGQVVGHYDDCSQGISPPVSANAAQAYAERVWAGQSESASHGWRVERVRQALEGQGLSMAGVVLPDYRSIGEPDPKAVAWAKALPSSTDGVV